MKKLNSQFNIRATLAILFALLAAALTALVLCFSPKLTTFAAINEGDPSYSSTALPIYLDINGDKPTEGTVEDTADKVKSNQKPYYYKRTMSTNALIEAYRSQTNVTQNIKDLLNGAQILRDPNVYGSDTDKQIGIISGSTHLSVTADDAGGTQHNYNTFTFEALSAADDPVYLMLYATSGGTNVPMYFAFHISSTFPTITNVSTYYIDTAVNQSAYNITEPSFNIENYTNISFVLADYMVNKSATCDPKIYYTPAGSTQMRLLTYTGSNDPWIIRDTTHFQITSVANQMQSILPPTSLSIVDYTKVENNYINPHVDFYPEVNYENVNEYVELRRTEDPNFTVDNFYNRALTFDVGITDKTSTVTLNFKTKFISANPQRLSLPSAYTELNMSSPYAYDIAENKYYVAENITTSEYLEEVSSELVDTTKGYSAILVSPEQLVNYPRASNQILKFATANMTYPSTGIIVTRLKSDIASSAVLVDKFIIKAQDSGSSTTATFNISFGTSGVTLPGGDNKVSINFTTYGNYAINMDGIRGKKSTKINVVTDSAFEALRNDNFFLKPNTDSRNPSVVSGNTDMLTVSFSDNVLTLTPVASGLPGGEGDVYLTMTFVNLNNRTITVTTKLHINLNAGSLFAEFTDWQVGLIIAAAIVGFLIIVLIIVWIFLRSVHKQRQLEMETAAPTSSYIIKLNNQIASARVGMQNMQQQQQFLALGAAPQAPTPSNTLQLAAGASDSENNKAPDNSYVNEQNSSFEDTASGVTNAIPNSKEITNEVTSEKDDREELYKLIKGYISDEELLERIYTEKYEPKGMVRRTFFKSKDLQERELDKEKRRIIDRYKTPMPMSEAILSDKQVAEGAKPKTNIVVPTLAEINNLLGYDVEHPVDDIAGLCKPDRSEFSEDKLELDVDEKSHYEITERNLKTYNAENELALKRQKATDAVYKDTVDLRDKIAKETETYQTEIESMNKSIEELEIKLASAKKDKDKINADIKNKEKIIADNTEKITANNSLSELAVANVELVEKAANALKEFLEDVSKHITETEQELEKAKVALDAKIKEEEAFQLNQQHMTLIEALKPLLQEANSVGRQIQAIDGDAKMYAKEREGLKSEVVNLRNKLLSSTDRNDIALVNEQINMCNKYISEVEANINAGTKQKGDLAIQFKSSCRKAIEYITENKLEFEEVVSCEDVVIGTIALNALKENIVVERDRANEDCIRLEAELEKVSLEDDTVSNVAIETAATIQEIQARLEVAQSELLEEQDKLIVATDEEEIDRINLVVESKKAALSAISGELEVAENDAQIRKIQAQSEHDKRVDDITTALNEARESRDNSERHLDNIENNTAPLDLIQSGSGVISQERRQAYIDDLKGKLSKAKSADELNVINTQIAGQQSEQDSIATYLNSEEQKLYAEKVSIGTQEAIRKADEIRRIAEQRAEEEKQKIIAEADAKKEKAIAAYEAAYAPIKEQIDAYKAEHGDEPIKAYEAAVEAAEKEKADTLALITDDMSDEDKQEMTNAAQEAYDAAIEAAVKARDEALAEFEKEAVGQFQKKLDLITATRDREVAEADKMRAAAISKAEATRMQILKDAESARNAADQARSQAEEARLKASEEAEAAKREAESARRKAREESDAAKAAAEAAKVKAEEAEAAKQAALDEAEKARQEAEEIKKKALEDAERAKREAEEEAEKARNAAREAAEEERRRFEEEAERARLAAQEEAERAKLEAQEEVERAKREAEEEKQRMLKEAEEERQRIQAEEEERAKREAEEAEKRAKQEAEEAEKRKQIEEKITRRKEQVVRMREGIGHVTDETSASALREQFYTLQLSLDEDERNSKELSDMITKAMDDASHAGQIASLKAQADKKPQRILKKVTERVNVKSRPSGSRPSGSRPAGSRPAGARPSGSRPAGSRPAGAKSGGARPAGARPAGARPAGSRPTGSKSGGARPAGSRPAGARPPAKKK